MRKKDSLYFFPIVFYDFVVVVVVAAAAYSIPQLMTFQLSQHSSPKGKTRPIEV